MTMATSNNLFSSPQVKTTHDGFNLITCRADPRSGTRSNSHTELHNMTRNKLPFSWLRCFFHAFKATGQFHVKLEFEAEKWSRGMVSVLRLNGIQKEYQRRRSVSLGEHTVEQENHNSFTQIDNSFVPTWFVPFGPANLPPIFTIGLGISADAAHIGILTELEQHIEWILTPSYLPENVTTKLLHIKLDQLALISPHWCSLSGDEIDQFNANVQLVWFQQCMRETGMTMDSLINLNMNSICQGTLENHTSVFSPMHEIYIYLKRYVEEYLSMGNSNGTEEIEFIVSVCLQLIVQVAVRRLEEVVHRICSTCDNLSLQPIKKTISSNLNTMTSYNSLACTSSISSNEPLRSETCSLVIHEQSVPSRIGSIQPAQVVSIRFSKTSSNGENEMYAKSLDSEHNENVCSSPLTGSMRSSKRVNQPSPQLIQKPLAAAGRHGITETNLPEFPLSLLTPCGEGDNLDTARFTKLSVFKSRSSNDLQSIMYPFLSTESASHLHNQLSQTKHDQLTLSRFSQSTPDMQKFTSGSLSCSSKLMLLAPVSKISEKPSSDEVHRYVDHSMLPFVPFHEHPNRTFHSGDQAVVSQSKELSAEFRQPTIREMLSFKLISRVYLELTRHLSGSENEAMNLLPALRSPHVITQGNKLIDQTISVSLAYRINQLSNSVSLQLSELITAAPINVGLIMDKLLLDNLNETTEMIPSVDVNSFTGYEILHYHASNLVNEMFQINEHLRTDPNTFQVKTDSIATTLSLLWAAAYPAACFTIDLLLTNKTLTGTCSCVHSKPEQSIECRNFDLSSQSDPTYQSDVWTTLVSTVPYHMAVINTVQSSSDSKLVTGKWEESRKIFSTDSDDSLQQQDDSLPICGVDIIESRCFSPQPITCISGSAERNMLRYISVKSSQSDLTSRSSSVNQSLEHITSFVEPELSLFQKKLNLTFGLSYETQISGDACGKITLQPIMSPGIEAKTEREPVQSVAPNSHKTIQFCTACTNRLLACLHQNVSRPTVIGSVATNQDMGVQYFQLETPLNVGDMPSEISKYRKSFTSESDCVQLNPPDLTCVMQNIDGAESGQLTYPPDHYKPNLQESENHKAPDELVNSGCGDSQNTTEDLFMSPPPFIYRSCSISVRDREPALFENTNHDFSLSTVSVAKRIGRTMSPVKNSRLWPDPKASNLCRTRSTTKPSLDSSISTSANEECTGLMIDTVLSLREGAFQLEDTETQKSQNEVMKKKADGGQSQVPTDISATNPFYSCLKDLRDCLNRTEEKLTLVNYLVTQQYEKDEKHRLESYERSTASPAIMHQGKPFEKSLVPTWSSSIKHYASQSLLCQPRCQPIPPKKHLSLSNLATHQTNHRVEANRAFHSPSKRQNDSKPTEHLRMLQPNELGARWTVDDIRSRGPGLFPSPSMELPVRANLPIVYGPGKHPDTLGKITAPRAGLSFITKSARSPQQSHLKQSKGQPASTSKQQQHLQQSAVQELAGRVGTALTQTGSRNTRRLCNNNSRHVAMV